MNPQPPVDDLALSVVAPCYNEEEGLAEFHRRTSQACAGLNISYELLLVNDGSRDGTWGVIQKLAAQDGHVVGVNLSRNHGHQLALTAGLTLCRGRRVMIIDADLQDPPELLLQMMQAMDRGVDVVYGRRRKRAGESAFKLATAFLFYRIIERLTDTAIPRDTGDFRLISRRALDAFLQMPERHRFVRGMVSWIGFKQEPIDYDRDGRFAGQTHYSVKKMFRFAVDALTMFSTRPLALATGLSLAIAALGVLEVVLAALRWLIYDILAGWTCVLIAVTFIGSAQLLALGIIGEYLGRLFEQSKGRPLFIIQDVIGRTK